jgi:predicted  nucleic acid-binding Zn-ribbon protein
MAQTLPKAKDDSGQDRREGPQIYVKETQLTLPANPSRVHDGSLFNGQDPRNHLFAQRIEPIVGRYLELAARLKGKMNPAADKEGDKASLPSGDRESAVPEAGTEALDADLQEAMASLPDLTEEQKLDLRLLKKLSFKIIDVAPNGDARLAYVRESGQDEERNRIQVEAILPVERLGSSLPLSTDDLVDVRFVQNTFDASVRKDSSDWQDEYLVRISGFTEVKSKTARGLEDKKQQLVKTKSEVEKKLIDIGKERKKLAGEREALLKQQAQDKEKIAKLEAEVKEQAPPVTTESEDPETKKPAAVAKDK